MEKVSLKSNAMEITDRKRIRNLVNRLNMEIGKMAGILRDLHGERSERKRNSHAYERVAKENAANQKATRTATYSEVAKGTTNIQPVF